MASLQSNPLGEDMQEVMGVGGDYDREEYEVSEAMREKERSTLVLHPGGSWRSQKKPFSSGKPT